MSSLLTQSTVMRWTLMLGLTFLIALPGYGQVRGLKAKKDSTEATSLAYQNKYALLVGINE